MAELPGIVLRAATALGLDPAGLSTLRGASGSSWDARPGVLRVGHRDVLDRTPAGCSPNWLDRTGCTGR